MNLPLSSIAFKDGDSIPARYTCEGQDISPPLAWEEPPQNTGAFALIFDDPLASAGLFTHWVLFNLKANVRELGEGIPAPERIKNGAIEGKSDFNMIGYGGPCPPPGKVHHYRFTIYALDRPLDLPRGASRQQLLDAMKGHTLAQGQLTGTYQRGDSEC